MNNSSSTGMDSEYTNGPAAGTHSEAFNQSQEQGAYDQLQSSQGNSEMGGGRGAMGSGVAGGYGGTSGYEQQQQQQSQSQTQSGEKADWLDKGMEAIGKKMGVNVSQKNADTAGDFLNKELREKAGRGLPGVN